MPLPKANYTQIPNLILESVTDLKESELRLLMVFCRQCFGWQTSSVKLGYKELKTLTGLSKSGLQYGIENLIARKWLTRIQEKDGTIYNLDVEGGIIEIPPDTRGWYSNNTTRGIIEIPPAVPHYNNKESTNKEVPPLPPKGGQVELEIKDQDSRPKIGEVVIPEPLRNPKFIEAWEEYVAYRKRSKFRSLLPISVRLQFEDFVQWGVEVSIAQIKLTMRKGYQGIIDPLQVYGNTQPNNGVAERRVNRNLGTANENVDPSGYSQARNVVKA